MRKPRDIDAELRALQDKAKGLKAKRTQQLGELVAATKADGLDLEVLAGVLLEAVERAKSDTTAKEAWQARGRAFFHRGKRAAPLTAENLGAALEGVGGGAAPNGGDDATG